VGIETTEGCQSLRCNRWQPLTMEIEEYRKLMGKTEMTDDQIKELVTDVEDFVSTFLDKHFEGEFIPDDV